MRAFLEHRKEVRLEEIRSQERRDAINAMEFASKEQVKLFERVADIMANQNELSNRALTVAIETNRNILRAAAKTDSVVLAGNLLSVEESKELLGSPRRTSSTKIVEQEMKVVDVNTSDPTKTSVIVEDIDDGSQYKVVFADRLIDTGSRQILFEACEKRKTAWFRLRKKEVENETLAVEILDVKAAPPEGALVSA